ncbi:ABC transporter permease [Streptacidiphilus monticola]|jgi:simple sugar transport system permease protein|uniref:ABC transporter permease n=1 Tax=Streptacidiphilus monticola TaxID=2161674 RepID=A0ABW1G3Y9_9ACTN
MAKARSVGTPSRSMVYLMIAAGLIVLAAVRAITDSNDLTSSGQIGGMINMAVPIAMTGLGGLWSERSGVVNIGLEGMLILGTFFGAWGDWHWGPWAGLITGMIGGAVGGLLHAVVTVTFGVDHVVSGVAINLLALSATGYLAKLTFYKVVGSKQSPPLQSLPVFNVPGLSHWLATLEAHHWFLISDLAGIIGGFVTQMSVLTVICAAMLVLTWYIIWRTPFGLRVRSCGENPFAAESLGVNVYLHKYIAVVVSGALAGLGGVFMVTVSSNIYQDGQTGGRGFIGLAALIFGNWKVGGLTAGAGLFGYTDSLQLRGSDAVHSLLLGVAVLLLGIAIRLLLKRSWSGAVASLVAAAVFAVWYATTNDVPAQLVSATPYVITLVVLAVASQRLRMPKADGLVYRRGEGK